MTTPFQQATDLAVQSAHLTPYWVEQPYSADVPVDDGDGVDVAASSQVAVLLLGRRSFAFRSAVLRFTTADLTDTYTVTVDGNDVDFDAAAAAVGSEAAMLEALAQAINDDGTVGAIVTATATDTELLLEGIVTDSASQEANFTLALATAGSGALVAVADVNSADVTLYGKYNGAGSSAPGGWVKITDLTVTSPGLSTDYEVPHAGRYARLHLQVTATTGPADGAGVGVRPTLLIGRSAPGA